MRTSTTLGIVAAVAIFSFWGGWFVRGPSGRDAAPAQPVADSSVETRGAGSARCPDPNASDVGPGTECCSEVDALRDELSALRSSGPRCDAQDAAHKPVSDEEFAAFRDKILDAADAIEYDGEVQFDCEEFPCIAMFEADFDTQVLERSLAELYGDDVAIMTQRHSSVGPGGSRKMRFAAVVPRGRESEVERRFKERTWQYLIQGHLDGPREADDE